MKNYVPAIIWALIILALSISPSIQMPETFFSPDKLGHISFYGVLSFLMLWGNKQQQAEKYSIEKYVVFIASFYGFILECIQFLFFPNRYFEIWDIVANISGCLVAKVFFDKIYH